MNSVPGRRCPDCRQPTRRSWLRGAGAAGLAAAGLAAWRSAAAWDDPPSPTYPARPAPAFEWHYRLSRGSLSGTGVLRWEPAGDAYRLTLQGRVPLLGAVITQTSAGRLGPQGLAPGRHGDRRLGRPLREAVFDAAAGRITFTDAPEVLDWRPGVQDRLSWMIQLAAIAQASPAAVARDREVAMGVVGARGDADVWHLRSSGERGVRLGGATVPAIHLARLARQPGDSQAEVWLDTARHSLPVRARMTDRHGEAFDLVLDGPAG